MCGVSPAGVGAVAAKREAASRAWGSPPTYVVMLIAVGGVGIGALVLFADWWKWRSPNAHEVLHSSTFVLWASLICAQTTLWALAAGPVYATLRRHRQGWQGHRAEIVASCLLLVVAVAAVAAAGNILGEVPQAFPHSHAKTQTLTGVALVFALSVSVSIWLIRGRLTELRAGAGKKEIELFIEFRTDLERLLAILGTIVGLAVLASAALRQVVLGWAAFTDTDANFPADYPLLYGLILSALVALIYVPTYLALLEAGTELRDSAAPLLEPDDPNFDAAAAKRKTLTDLLGLDVSASTSFRAGAAILSPLFAALLTLLPKFG